MRRKKNNKRKYTFLAVFLIADILLILTIFKSSNARFVSEAKSGTELNVALYAISLEGKMNDGSSMNIQMDNLEPDGKTRYYYFNVYNTNENGVVTNTDISYYLKFVSTTNIPLEYHVYEGLCTQEKNAIITDVTSTDGSSSDAFFRTMITEKRTFGHTEKESNSYCLAVNFPKKYNTYNYQNLIESIQVRVISKQIMDTD